MAKIFCCFPELQYQLNYTAFLKYGCALFLLYASNIGAAVQPSVNYEPYPFTVDSSHQFSIAFGKLTVPENYQHDAGPTVEIAFTVIQANPTVRAKEAVLLIPGGPGVPATYAADMLLKRDYITRVLRDGGKDVVIIDPRATGLSSPLLCEELNQPEFQFWYGMSISAKEIKQRTLDTLQRCRDRFEQQGRSFEHYSSMNFAHDAEHLRTALGYSSWLLLGHSYGSRYAQDILTSYPDTVDGALLSAIVPRDSIFTYDQFANTYELFNRIVRECQVQASCQQSFPDFAVQLPDVMKRLESVPIELKIENSSVDKITIDGFAFYNVLLGLAYERAGIQIIPLLVNALHNRNDWVLRPIAASLMNIWGDLHYDTFLVVSCNDSVHIDNGYTNAPAVEGLQQQLFEIWQSHNAGVLCGHTGHQALQQHTAQIPQDIPIVLLDGEYDPVTPTQNSYKLLNEIANAKHLTILGWSHDLRIPVQELYAQFLLNPFADLDLQSFQPANTMTYVYDIKPSPFAASLATAFASGNLLDSGIILALSALFSVIAGIFIVTKKHAKQRKSYLLLVISNLLVIILITIGVFQTVTVNQYAMMVGFVNDWAWVTFTYWPLLIGTVWQLWRFATATGEQAHSYMIAGMALVAVTANVTFCILHMNL